MLEDDQTSASDAGTEDKVDLLWANYEASQRPWYVTPSVLISIAALVSSLAISLYGISDTRNERAKKATSASVDDDLEQIEKENDVGQLRLERLREIAQTAGSIRNDASKLAASARDVERSKTYNAERQVLLEEADAILADPIVAHTVSAAVVTTLGFEHQLDGRWAKARLLYERAIALATEQDDPTAQVVAHRSMASLLAIPDTGIQDLDVADLHWKQALLEGDSDLSHFSDAQTYQAWANSEAVLGQHDKVALLLAKSRQEYESLHVFNQYRYLGPDLLDESLDYYADPDATTCRVCRPG